MDILEAIRTRHSVRSYTDKPIEADVIERIKSEIDSCNKESGLNMQLVTDEPNAFDSIMAHYGKFSGVRNYIALIGKKESDLQEKIGYYGERIVLLATTLGLQSCWVASTFSKSTTKKNCEIGKDEKLIGAIALGYGTTQGVQHKGKAMNELCKVDGEMPEWFKSGMEAAMFAPTAINQQKFMFRLNGNRVTAERTGGFYSDVDLGIVKFHFEVGAGIDNFIWEG